LQSALHFSEQELNAFERFKKRNNREKAMNLKRMLGTALATVLMSMAIGTNVRAADLKIGYIDLQKAIQETSAGKKAKKELEKEFNSKKEELSKREGNIKKMQEDFEKKKNVLTEEVKQQKAGELQQEMLKYRDLLGQSQVNIQKKEQELTKPILEKLQDIVDKIAKEGSYTLILEKSEQSVIWAKKDIDLTDELVKQYEKTVK
jgi:outer membrane protein